MGSRWDPKIIDNFDESKLFQVLEDKGSSGLIINQWIPYLNWTMRGSIWNMISSACLTKNTICLMQGLMKKMTSIVGENLEHHVMQTRKWP